MKTIFYNAKVYTGTLPLQEAFLIENNCFKAVGSNQEILALKDEKTILEDMQGSFISAGFNDSHMHLLNYGQSLKMAALHKHTESLAGMLSYLKEYVKENPVREGQWIRGRGWNQDYFSDTDAMPTRADLDTVSKDTPILLTRACGHVCAVNSKALELAGITKDTKAPLGGAIGMKDGEPDGLFYDNAIDLINTALPLPAKEDIKEMIRLACKALNSYGITSSQTDDYCVFREVPFEVVNEAYKELEASGELTVRVYEQSNFTELSELKRFVESGCVTGSGTDHFKIGPLKMLGDGSLGGRTAHLTKPYNDDPSTCGFSLFTDEHMNEMVSYANENGMQIAIHAIGDACLDQVLNAIDLALEKHPRNDHRHGIVHCQISRKDQLERIANMHLVVYAQSIFLDYDNHIVEERVGKELASTSYSWKTLKNNGVVVANGSDCPVELPDVLEGIECAVTRTSLDGCGPYLPKEAFTVEEALNSFTKDAAYTSFEENKKGQIKPGFLADFTVLHENPFETDPDKIHKIKIDHVYLDGKCLF